jgi:ribosomal-protein-alanine N-acetyltransferase
LSLFLARIPVELHGRLVGCLVYAEAMEPRTGRTVLETPRLTLRELVPEDEDALTAMYADPEVMRWIGRGGVRTREDARESIRRQLAEYRQRGYGEWATTLRSSDEPIGMCGLIRWPDIDDVEEVEVAYLLARHVWGKGYATEAAAAIRDWGLRELRRDRFVSLVYHDNVGSINVARKIGMTWEKDVTFGDMTVALFSLGARAR